MTVRVAINGFGRIGRNILRAIVEQDRQDIEVVAVNDLAPAATNAHLLKYDSVHGRFPGEVSLDGDTLTIKGRAMKVLSERDLASLPWGQHGVDIVLECTGAFTDGTMAKGHRDAGAKKVLISAPGKNVDRTVVLGVNHNELTASDAMVSNGSCTTNCIAPLAKVLHEGLGIERGHMTTIHSYTNDQNVLDVYHKDPHRARAAGLSMIPTTTGAARAVGLVLPALDGKLDGGAIRVPTPNVSLVDFTFVAARDTSADEVNDLVRQAANSNELKGILGYHEEPLVSVDFNHDPLSSTVDISATKVSKDGKLVRVASWYDNEWGFSCRMADVAVLMHGLN